MQAESPPQRGARLPPQDVDAERSVLGAMLLEEEAVSETMALIKPEDFYRPAHGRIFEAMTLLYERGEPIDEVTLSAQLKSSAHLESAGGSAYLAGLTQSVPTAANVEYYAKIVRSRALTRRLISAATAIAGSGYDGNGDIDQLLDEAESKIFEITSSRDQRAFAPLKDVVKDAFKLIEKLYENKQPITGVSTGFTDLDKCTSGCNPQTSSSWLVVLPWVRRPLPLGWLKMLQYAARYRWRCSLWKCPKSSW